MIRVVQANPAMDRIEVLDVLLLDGVNRATASYPMAGGKGGNVARAVRALGAPVAVYGFAGGPVGDFLRREFAVRGIEDRQIAIEGATRVCTIIVETGPRRSTVLNEQGPIVDDAAAEALARRLREDCRTGDLVVLSGSLPRGIASDFYARLVEEVRASGARTIVDARGDVLACALSASPWMAKMNAHELGEALGRPLAGAPADELTEAARSVLGERTEAVVVTLGRDGALAVGASGAWRARVPVVDVVNVTGSGDLFLAGYVVAVAQGADVPAAVRFASACGVAGARSLLPELPSSAELHSLVELVRVEAA